MLLALVARTSLKPSGTALASLLRCSHTFAPSHVPVVVVGAGPTGLVLSCLLSQYGMHSSQQENCMFSKQEVTAELKGENPLQESVTWYWSAHSS
jgi:hypothetical protein